MFLSRDLLYLDEDESLYTVHILHTFLVSIDTMQPSAFSTLYSIIVSSFSVWNIILGDTTAPELYG